jgi:hypothetical protein
MMSDDENGIGGGQDGASQRRRVLPRRPSLRSQMRRQRRPAPAIPAGTKVDLAEFLTAVYPPWDRPL